MKTRTLVILLVVLGLLAGAGALIKYRTSAPGGGEVLGAKLLAELPANRIAAIYLLAPDNEVSLTRKDDKWVVKERFEYPADFDKIKDFVRKLKEVKIGRQFEADEEVMRRLSLKDPGASATPAGQQGARVELQDAQGKELAGLVLGSTRKPGGERDLPSGQYVKVRDKSMVYLIDEHFPNADWKPETWLQKDLVDMKADQVRRIAVWAMSGGELLYAFERSAEGGDLRLSSPPVTGKIKQSALNRLAGALSGLQLEDVVDPATTPESLGFKSAIRLDYHLFDGRLYRIYVSKTGTAGAACYTRVEVDYQTSPEPAEEENQEAEKDNQRPSPEELARQAKQSNGRLAPWIFLLPQWKCDAFASDLGSLLAKAEE